MTPRRLACVAALALSLAGTGLAGCGDDEPDTAESAPAQGSSTVSEPETTTEEPPESEDGEITDEGHEGGGPDPGTEEAESAAEHSGGVEVEDPELEVEPKPEGGSGSNGSGGSSPPDDFDQFCEENPGACD